MNKIPFNKVYLTGNEGHYLSRVIGKGKLTGSGEFSQKCTSYFETRYGFNTTFLTPSCTAALETAALLLEIKPGDEVIMPSYTFVSSANAFALRGAKIVFADSGAVNPNIDAAALEQLITPRTRAIVPVHYGGIACDMDTIMALAEKYNLFIIEDAAHAIAAYYKDKPLGSIGQLSAFSFHETKNITCGEGGMLAVNDKRFSDRAAVITDKGTNRNDFIAGKTKKYEWVDLGSSYCMGELNAAFLLAQLEALDSIQEKRNELWNQYYNGLNDVVNSDYFSLPHIPSFATHNASVFYIVCSSQPIRNSLIKGLAEAGITAAFHYQPLHLSPFYSGQGNKQVTLANAEKYGNCLLRLPLHAGLSMDEVNYVIEQTKKIIKTI